MATRSPLTSAATGETAQSGWPALFWSAFTNSKNPMVLLDDDRRQVEVNGSYLTLLGYSRRRLVGHPIHEIRPADAIASEQEWRTALRQKHFTGVADLLCADGKRVTVEYAGHPELVTGKQLVLFVVLRAARRGRPLQADEAAGAHPRSLSSRELDVIELIASGLESPEIGRELGIAPNTVRSHVRNAMTKVGARSRAQLVAISLAEGLFFDGQSQ